MAKDIAVWLNDNEAAWANANPVSAQAVNTEKQPVVEDKKEVKKPQPGINSPPGGRPSSGRPTGGGSFNRTQVR